MVKVWLQALVEGAAEVELDGKTFPVRETPRKRLREVDFVFEGQPLRGLEQNPKTESRWAQLARAGHKVIISFGGAVRWGCRRWKSDAVWREEEKKRWSKEVMR